jgi:prepilin-type N-terminal cleavage/methylation domain-containing protein
MRFHFRHSARRAGFTLMETVIALAIFSLAVVALAEAIQQSGKTSNIIREDIRIHDRMAALTAETTRLIALTVAGARPQQPAPIDEGGVTYQVKVQEIKNLVNKDKVPVEGLWQVITTADWKEGTSDQHLEEETWVYPPLLPRLQ